MDEHNAPVDEQSGAHGNEESASWPPSIVPQGSGGGEVVNYYFPVELIVAGKLTPEQVKELKEEIFQDFSDSINRRLP